MSIGGCGGGESRHEDGAVVGRGAPDLDPDPDPAGYPVFFQVPVGSGSRSGWYKYIRIWQHPDPAGSKQSGSG